MFRTLAMLCAFCLGMGGSLALGDDAVKLAPSLPHHRLVGSIDYYPATARAHGIEGRVELEFNIDSSGRANHVSVLLADDKSLAEHEIKTLGVTQFDVSPDWKATGPESVRYRLGTVYCLPPSGQREDFPDSITPIFVTGSRIPGAPVKSRPRPGATGRCARSSSASTAPSRTAGASRRTDDRPCCYLNRRKLTVAGTDDLHVLNAIVAAVGKLGKSTAEISTRSKPDLFLSAAASR